MRISFRPLVAVSVVTAALWGVSAPARATVPADDAQAAAEAIVAARERANQAAEDYFQAEAELAELGQERQLLAQRVVDLERQVERLQRIVTEVAVNRYVGSGAGGIPILTDVSQPTEQLHRTVLSDVATDSSATTIDDYEAVGDELDDARADLGDAEDALEQRQGELLNLQAEAEAEVARLRALEEQRLHDEAVQQALAALALERQRQLEELERRTAEAERIAEEERDAAAAGAASRAPITLPDDDGDPSTPPPTLPVETLPPVDPTGLGHADDSSAGIVATLGRSAGAVGGRTGGGGVGSNPRAAGVGFLDAIVCPVLGGSAPYDSWLAPRSGGRLHQGIDLLAPTGTPLVAVVSGVVTQKTNRLGGTTISLMGDNGNRYYYAHLSAWEGAGGHVDQGAVIGYVGDSGNATGIPHLHFEIRPGNGVPVNPFPSVQAAGC